MWPSDLLSLFGAHDRNKSPTVGSRDHFPLGFIAAIGAVMALQTFMSLHSCKFGVGVGSLRRPNFPFSCRPCRSALLEFGAFEFVIAIHRLDSSDQNRLGGGGL